VLRETLQIREIVKVTQLGMRDEEGRVRDQPNGRKTQQEKQKVMKKNWEKHQRTKNGSPWH